MPKVDKTSAFIFVLMGAVVLLAGLVFNRPTVVPAWPETVNGVSFSPFRFNQSPQNPASFPSEEEVLNDLKLVSNHAGAVRT